MYIVTVGNPFDGFSFYGPFRDIEDAIDYGDRHFFGHDWWAVSVEPIKETE